MRAFLFGLAVFAALATHGRSHTAPPSLTFYVVSETKIEGGRFIDSPDLPKVGYIGATPDLTVTKLESVVQTVSASSYMVDKDGKETQLPQHLALAIQMRPEDARKFTALTERAIGKRVLLMLGERPLIAPFVGGPISTKSMIITSGNDAEIREIENELQKLVQ